MAQKLKRVLVLHGPNLNLLGEREPEVYGRTTLSQLNSLIRKFAKENQLVTKIFQSNHEGKIIDLLHQNRKWANAVIINPGAYTHYSYAIRDAISSIQLPVLEVHLSDISKREEFRRVSVIAPVCVQQISGLGPQSYIEAISYILNKIPTQV